MQQIRLERGQTLLAREEEQARAKRREESKGRQSVSGIAVDDGGNYRKEERIVYVSGFDRGLPFVDLENYLKKYGEVLHVNKQIDSVKILITTVLRGAGTKALSSSNIKIRRAQRRRWKTLGGQAS